MPLDLQLTDPAPLSPLTLIVNLLLGAMLSFVLGWHFKKYGKTLTNRAALARILPFICLTTILIISVVKSSLALSLGLVGALSIVRFRTPIKEPEELAYLFMAIAMGLALGADQRTPVLVASTVILGFMTLASLRRRSQKEPNLYLNVDLPVNGEATHKFEEICELVASHSRTTDVRRVDIQKEALQATYFVHCDNEGQLQGLISHLREKLPTAAITFVDQDRYFAG